MKKSHFSDRQILRIMKHAEVGTPIPELCLEHGMSSVTFYNWRRKYGGMEASIIAQMKELEAENRCVKKVYVEERLKRRPSGRRSPKLLGGFARREMAKTAVEQRKIGIRLASQAFGISEIRYRYQWKCSDENAEISDCRFG